MALFAHALALSSTESVARLRLCSVPPTEIQSMSENDFECLARTGVKAPVAIFPILDA